MKFPRAVWILSFVSLFTDMASEMLYPVMPIYFKHIGMTVAWIGLMEGLAEFIAGISKSYFGRWSDLREERVPFVRVGYGLSAISKPLMALWQNAGGILLARSTDRIGKGIRTGARDAMLSEASDEKNRGSVFGFHRAMDTLGAFLGPGLSLLFLNYFPGEYRKLFYLAFFPGLVAVALTYLLKSQKRTSGFVTRIPSFRESFSYWKKSPTAYRKLIPGLLFFSLFNSSDLFLLLRIADSGVKDTSVIMIYMIYNLAYAMLAYPAGLLADHWGMKKVFLTGILIFSAVYWGFAFNLDVYGYGILLLMYAAYAALTEGIAKAWITLVIPKGESASAIGFYTACQSLCALLASLIAGWVWHAVGATPVFILSAVMAMIAAFWLLKTNSSPQ